MLVKILLIPFFLALSAFFSGSETAFFSLQPLELERLRQRPGGMRVAALMRLLSRREALLTTVLIGNEVVNVALSSVAASLALSLLGDRGLGISVAVMTFLLVLYGEITPKALAVSRATTWALVAAPLLLCFSFLVYPFRWFLTIMTKGITHGITEEERSVGEEEFKALVKEGRRKGILKETEREMIMKVFRFTHTRVGEIMTPRTEMFALEVGTPLKKAYESLKEVTYREIPLYEDHLDNMVGVMRTNNLLGLPWGLVKAGSLRELMEEPYFVPESKEAAELLREFQRKRLHMAIVIDEYGGVAGLVTLEDIIEELVGELSDEFGGEGEEIKEVAPGIYRVSPRMSLEDLEERLGIEPPKDVDIDTVGGLVFHLFGRVPKKGEFVEYRGWRLRIEEMKRTRILRVLLERTSEDEKAQDSLH